MGAYGLMLLLLVGMAAAHDYDEYESGIEKYEYWEMINGVIDQINEWRLNPSEITTAADEFIALRAFNQTYDGEANWPYFCWDRWEDLLQWQEDGYFKCDRKGMLRSGLDKAT